MAKLDEELLVKATTEIVVACLNKNSINPLDIPNIIREVRAALEATPSASSPQPEAPVLNGDQDDAPPARPELTLAANASERPTPAVPIEESVRDDYLVSLEDGGRFRSLRRHLMAKYGMTPDDYRRKWNLPIDYPMVAPSYARDRAEVAKRIGLGRKPKSNALKLKSRGRA